MKTNEKTNGKVERKATSAAAAEWNRTGYDYSGLWHMFDHVVAAVKKTGKNNAVVA